MPTVGLMWWQYKYGQLPNSHSWPVRLLKLETICTHKSCWYHGVAFTESFCRNSFLFTFYLFVCILPNRNISFSSPRKIFLIYTFCPLDSIKLKKMRFAWWWAGKASSHWIVETFQPALIEPFSTSHLPRDPTPLAGLLFTKSGDSPLIASATCLCFHKTRHCQFSTPLCCSA